MAQYAWLEKASKNQRLYMRIVDVRSVTNILFNQEGVRIPELQAKFHFMVCIYGYLLGQFENKLMPTGAPYLNLKHGIFNIESLHVNENDR